MLRKTVFAVIIILLSYRMFSQQTLRYNNYEYTYQTAKELYENKMYASAQKMFAQILMHEGIEHSSYKDEAAYYISMCAINLYNLNAEYLLQNYIETHLESNNSNDATFQMANYHFRNKKYKDAIEWYLNTKVASLTKDEKSEYYFKLGFSYFAQKNYEQAEKTFYEIKDEPSRFGQMSLYFYSHLKYVNKQYQTALNGFLILENLDAFAAISPFYIIQIYYLQDKYDDVIAYSPKILNVETGTREAEISKLTGSAYYRKGNFTEAIPFFQKYMEIIPTISDHDYYELGFSYYATKQYDMAASTFTKIKSLQDTLSQNFTYHLGDCYLKLGKKTDARKSFEIAAKHNYNPTIKEDALFNFAQLSYELSLSPFNEAISAFEKYIQEYPNSYRTDKAYDYLIDALLSAKNYQQAINVIEKMPKTNSKLDAAYQRLTYFRGLEHFTKLDYKNAIEMFDKSLKYNMYDIKLKALSYYWKAEANYRLNKIDDAILQFQDFVNVTGSVNLEEYGKAHYNLGYAYFNKKDYVTANSWFRKFEMNEKNTQTTLMNDALNRIGDCYYILKDFELAANYYKKATTMGLIATDYSLYQMSLSYGGSKMANQKIWSLKKLLSDFPNSEYAGNANFEIARTYHIALKDLDSAQYYYNLLLTNYPKSSMKVAAMSSLGAIYFSEKNYPMALEIYKQVIAEFPNTEEAANANDMIRTVYIENENPEEYLNYANTEATGISVSEEEQDELIWTTARKQYFDKKYEDALVSITNYITKFSNGKHFIEANYYKAELHYYFNDKNAALINYKSVADAAWGSYSEESILKLTSILYDKEDWETAYDYYNKLYPLAENKSTKLIASTGKMRSAYNIQDYDNVIPAAIEVLENQNSNEEQIREAYYKTAKSYYEKENKIRALGYFEQLSKEVISYEGAESKYRIAEINFTMNKDSIAEEIIYEFAQSNTPHAYWIAKSYILLAQIYKKSDDRFSAKHALHTVINSYENETDSIKDEANDMLNQMIIEEENAKVEQDYLNLKIEFNND